jgi:FAD:protein FMN transferase
MKHDLMKCRIALCLILLLTVAEASTARPRLSRFEFSETHMGTRFRIVLYAMNRDTAAKAAADAFNRIARLDATMSDYRESSELMSVCREAFNQPVKVSDDLYNILARSQELAEHSNGAFDVTVGPVVRLWRRARRVEAVPERQALAAARALVGYNKLHLDAQSRTIKLDQAGMLIDLGGIAKGYAADEALKVLKQHGITRALVAAGGDIVASRPPPGARGWRIGIATADSSPSSPTRYLWLQDAAVSTSGDEEQFVEIAGVRYSHIVDPRTGMALTGHRSVTVVAANGTTSDAMATAASVMEPQAGLRLVDATNDAAVLIVQAHQSGYITFSSKRWSRLRISAKVSPANANIQSTHRR